MDNKEEMESKEEIHTIDSSTATSEQPVTPQPLATEPEESISNVTPVVEPTLKEEPVQEQPSVTPQPSAPEPGESIPSVTPVVEPVPTEEPVKEQPVVTPQPSATEPEESISNVTPVVELTLKEEPIQEQPVVTPQPVEKPEINNIFPTLETTTESQVATNLDQTIKQPEQEVRQEQSVSNEVTPEEQTPQVSLNGTEKVVYEYKPKKSLGPIPVILFFLAIGAIIVFLPNIQEAFTNLKNGKLPVSSNNTVNKPNEKKPSVETEKPQEKEYYDLSKDTVISIDKLTLSNFSKTKDNELYYLTFNIENKDNAPYVYQDNIYIRMYSSDELIGNALLEDNTFLPGTGKKELRLVIPESVYTRDFQIAVKKLTTSDYPDVELNTNLKEQQELTCSLEGRTLTYTFLNDELIGIDDQRTESTVLYSTTEEYNNALTSYRDKATRYNMITGITSSLTNNVNGFSFYVKIDPTTVTNTDLSSINDKAYYLGKTNAKTISFEMKARGYTCK